MLGKPYALTDDVWQRTRLLDKLRDLHALIMTAVEVFLEAQNLAAESLWSKL